MVETYGAPIYKGLAGERSLVNRPPSENRPSRFLGSRLSCPFVQLFSNLLHLLSPRHDMRLSTPCCLLAGLVMQHTAHGLLAGNDAPVMQLAVRQLQPGERTASYDTAVMPAEDGSNRTMATDDYDADKQTVVEKRAPSAADWKSRCPGGRIGGERTLSFSSHLRK